MTDHPTAEIVEQYRRGTLPPGLLLTVDDHLSDCADCRRRLGIHPGTATISAAIARPDEAQHLSYEQVERYVDGALDEVEREVLDSHLHACTSCTGEVGDLRTFKARLAMHAEPAAEPGVAGSIRRALDVLWSSPAVRIGVPAAAALALWILIPRSNPAPDSVSVSTLKPAPAAPLVALRDGEQDVTLGTDGRLDGLVSLSEDDRSRVARALAAGRIEVRSDAILRTQPGTLMGGRAATRTFAVVSPVGSVVESDRPEFTWHPLAGATGYVVSVTDERFNVVLESPVVTTSNWRSPRTLPRGHVYSWQVRASAPAGEVTAPAPPAAEARFVVIAADQAARLASARQASPPSHMLLAILYAEAGMVDAAEAELKTLQRDNPSSPVIGTLIESLRPPR